MPNEPEKVDLESPDLAAEAREKLTDLFPGVLADGVLDATRLAKILGTDVAAASDARERYGLMWAGKAEAVRSLQTPSRGTLIPDFNRSVDWDTAQNVFIEGDNLEVLKLLQKSYNDKVKLIYIDPPYNTGRDFIYRDDFTDGTAAYLRYTGQVDEEGLRTSTQTDLGGRRHSRWLSMMYPRLVLARNILRQDGAIFISIDDHEVEALSLLCDEVFGAENFVAKFPRVTKRAGKTSDLVAANHDYVIAYRRSDAAVLNRFAHTDDGFKFEDEHVSSRGLYKLNQTLDYGSIQYSASLDYEIEIDGHILRPGGASKDQMIKRQQRNPKTDWCWRWSRRLYDFGLANGFVVLKEGREGPRLYTKTYANATIKEIGGQYQVVIEGRTKSITSLEFTDNKYSNDNAKKALVGLLEVAAFDYTKPVELVRKLVELLTSPEDGDIVIDFFAGSGTTAHAVTAQNASDGGNRRSISVNLPEPTPENSAAHDAGYETVSDVTYARIMAGLAHASSTNKEGLKGFPPGESNFANSQRAEGEVSFVETTLRENGLDSISIAAEIFLKEGVTFDSQWERLSVAGADAVRAAGVLITLSHEMTDDITRAALDLGPDVLVFLEDGFAGRDAVKANAHSNAKQLGIKMKTV